MLILRQRKMERYAESCPSTRGSRIAAGVREGGNHQADISFISVFFCCCCFSFLYAGTCTRRACDISLATWITLTQTLATSQPPRRAHRFMQKRALKASPEAMRPHCDLFLSSVRSIACVLAASGHKKQHFKLCRSYVVAAKSNNY